jgi:hypothetical protein
LEPTLDLDVDGKDMLDRLYLNYDIERRDRPSDPHGGVLIAARNELLPETSHEART